MEVSDYTQHELQDDGTFRLFPVAWTIEPSPKETSQAVAIAFKFAVRSKWHPDVKSWSEDWAPGYYVEGRVYVIKADGTLSKANVKNLQDLGLWSGDFDDIAEGPPASVIIHGDVESSEWEGKTRWRVNWMNPDADEPKGKAGFSPPDPEVLSTLRKRFRSQIKALSGGDAGQVAAPPAAPAAVPPAAPSAPATQPAAAPQQQAAPPSPPAPPAPPATEAKQSIGFAPPPPTVAPAQPAGQEFTPPPTGDLNDDPDFIDADDCPF